MEKRKALWIHRVAPVLPFESKAAAQKVSENRIDIVSTSPQIDKKTARVHKKVDSSMDTGA